MIELTRKQVRMIRTTMRQALGITTNRSAPVVTFRSTQTGLLVQAHNNNVAIEYHIPGDRPPERCAVPYAALAACEGHGNDIVTVDKQGDTVTLRWTDAGIPQESQHAVGDSIELPNPPGALANIDSQFLSAMAEAVATTDDGSSRYALHCVRLRGSGGQIAATDASQGLIQTGYRFPWEDDVLVPACRAFNAKAFRSATEVTIGRTEDWVTIRAGAWTVHLLIEKEARFPAIEDQIPNSNSAATTLVLSDSDAEFLGTAMKRLPGAKDYNSPVTADLNGAVILRAKSAEQSTPTDLVLCNSRRDGEEIRVNTNRKFLARAVQLGFRDIHLRSADAPAYCTDGRRSYVWALLGKDGALQPEAGATRIESPLSPTTRTTRRRTAIPMTTTPQTTATVQNDETEHAPGILAQAEALRDSLGQALANTRQLIATIKKRRKQNRLVESTLRSLKQLERIGA